MLGLRVMRNGGIERVGRGSCITRSYITLPEVNMEGKWVAGIAWEAPSIRYWAIA